VLFLAGAAWLIWRQVTTPWAYSGNAVKPTPFKRYEFLFFAFFPSEDTARRATAALAYPGLNAKISLAPNGTAWHVTWSVVAKANDRGVFRLYQGLESHCSGYGGKVFNVAISNPPAPEHM
jgi:hypothetical protein